MTNNLSDVVFTYCVYHAVPTRLELATSAVTGRCSNQLRYETNFAEMGGYDPQSLT